MIIFTNAVKTYPTFMWIEFKLIENAHTHVDESSLLGGTFALYSFICRHAKVSLIPTQQDEDKDLSNYQLETPIESCFEG